MSSKKISQIGIIAAIYAVLTMVLSPISFGAVQCRVSDTMLFFSKKNKNFVAGCAIGCIVANLISPLGVIDMVIGGITNFIIGVAISRIRNEWIGIIAGSAIAGICIGIELGVFYSIPIWTSIISVAIGEVIPLTMGLLLSKVMKKNINKFIS